MNKIKQFKLWISFDKVVFGNESNPVVWTLGTVFLRACLAYASDKAQQPAPSIKQSLCDEERFHQMIQQNYIQEFANKNDFGSILREQIALSLDYGFEAQHLKARLKVLESLPRDKASYAYQQHEVSTGVNNLIMEHGLHKNLYETCYGNQFQQQVHKECLPVVENTAALFISSSLYDYKPEFVRFADSARECNQLDLSYKAITVLDVCWTFFDYGKAIAEGLACGVFDAAQTILEDPLQSALCVMAGEYVLAYQFSKMLFDVAQIGLITCIDPRSLSKQSILQVILYLL